MSIPEHICFNSNIAPFKLRPARLILSVIFIVSIFIPVIAAGQKTDDVDPEIVGDHQSFAPVMIDGVELFMVKGISTFTPEQRAKSISLRIAHAAKNSSLSADSVKLIADGDKFRIFAGSEFIMNLYESDAQSENINRSVMADLVLFNVKNAIDSYRYNRSRDVLLKKSLFAFLALVLLILLFKSLNWLGKQLKTVLENRIKARIEIVQNKSFNLIQATQLWTAFRVGFKVVRIAFAVFILAIFLQYILGLFPWTSNLASFTLNLFLNPIKSLLKGFVAFLPNLAFLIVIFFCTQYFLKLVKLLFNGIDKEGIVMEGFDAEWAMPTFRLVRIFIIAFAVIVAYPYIPGSDSSAFKGVTVFMGVLFSLGSSSFVSNIIAGYSMTYRKAFKIGDRIQVEDKIGFVEEQSLMVTRLRSQKNEEFVIPNSILLNSQITNFSKRARDLGLILHSTVGIGYETPWRQVDAMLKLAADRTEGLLKDPPPFVLKLSLGDFAVIYEINAYYREASKIQYYSSKLLQNILDVFNENNVQIMTPAYEGDPEIPKVVPREQWDAPLAKE